MSNSHRCEPVVVDDGFRLSGDWGEGRPACATPSLPGMSQGGFARRCFRLGRLGRFVLAVLAIQALALRAPAAKPYSPALGDPFLEPWRWTRFPELDGKEFQTLAEGKDGAFWFGVRDGVLRYDGKTWTRYGQAEGLPSGLVSSLLITRKGAIYAGTSSIVPGNFCYFHNGKWQPILSSSDQLAVGILGLSEGPDDSIWAVSSRAFFRWKDGVLTCYTGARDLARGSMLVGKEHHVLLPESIAQLSDMISSVMQDRSGGIWIGFSNIPSVAMWSPRLGEASAPAAWRIFDGKDGFKVGGQISITEGPDGIVYARHLGGSSILHAFDPQTNEWKHFDWNNTYGMSSRIADLLTTRDGTLWIVRHNQILARRQTGTTAYEMRDLDLSPELTVLREAADGSLWLGQANGKVLRIDYAGTQWTSYEGLHFQGETSDGAQWFIAVDGEVVRQRDGQWTAYGVEDGLMSAPVTLLIARDDRVWAAGSHHGNAAIASFGKDRWSLQEHPEMSWTVDYRSVLQDNDGSLWFGANSENFLPRQFKKGLLHLEIDGSGMERWTHIERPPVPDNTSGLAQLPDGRLILGGMSLAEGASNRWRVLTEPLELTGKWIDWVTSTPAGELWVSIGGVGVLRRQGTTWTKYDKFSGLADNMVSALFCDRAGTVWATTQEGISRFDGRTWSALAFPAQSLSIGRESGTMRQSRDGRLWLNIAKREWYFRAKSGQEFTAQSLPVFRTVGYLPEHNPPETRLVLTVDKVSQPGNTLISWTGGDSWSATAASRLQYSYRFDDGLWSEFTPETSKIFLALPSGRHNFEVRSRNLDLNVDPTPARFTFTVVPPVWRQGWFQGLMGAVLAALVWMEYRVLRHNRRLTKEVKERQQAQAKIERQNVQLEERKEELLAQKSELEQEIAERKRMEVEVEKTHKELVDASRKAGMAEIATGVLHNVGNVLNSVNVAASVLQQKARESSVRNLSRVVALLNEHAADFAAFVTQDARGKVLPNYLKQLDAKLQQEQADQLREAEALTTHVEHIIQIVAMQQNYAKASSSLYEVATLAEVVEDALRINAISYDRHGVKVIKEYDPVPPFRMDRHKVMQILINLLNNAKQACAGGAQPVKEVRVRVNLNAAGQAQVVVQDNGAGIAPEALNKIFTFGFTTRAQGHGYGLHGSANTATEMGAALTVQSDGPGRGAAFTLTLPVNQ